MSSKNEERIKNLLEEHYKKLKEEEQLLINSKVPSVFFVGIIAGIILTYSNILSILVGAIMGAAISTQYNKFMDKIVTNIGDVIKNIQEFVYKKIE